MFRCQLYTNPAGNEENTHMRGSAEYLADQRADYSWMTAHPYITFSNSGFGLSRGSAKKYWKSGRPYGSYPANVFENYCENERISCTWAENDLAPTAGWPLLSSVTPQGRQHARGRQRIFA
jgi:hypothetical protein